LSYLFYSGEASR